MTHAIYIAAILVLAGVVGWLWRERERLEAVCEDKDALATIEMNRADVNFDSMRYWQEIARLEGDDRRRTAESLTEAQDQLDQCQASNRSLRGWNGRYRRKIAALEDRIKDLELDLAVAEGEI